MLLLVALLSCAPVQAADAEVQRAYLEVTPESRDDLVALLDALEQKLESEGAHTDAPVVIVLHGDEAFAFTRQGYLDNRPLADRAALLDAYNLIEVRMCETWMNENGLSRSDILPFIDPVPYAPEEIRRLQAEGYQPLGADL
jgi:intracellular sulfur oxidation DsrE/DsrF family protein